MPAATPETKIENKKKLTQVGTTVYLYDQNESRLGLILRPVRRINDMTELAKQLGAAAEGSAPKPSTDGGETQNRTTDPSAQSNRQVQEAVGSLSEILKANLIAEAEIRSTQNRTQYDEYGPLICMPLPEKIKDSLRVSYSNADLGMAAVGAVFGQDIASPNKDGDSLASNLVGNASYVIRTLIAALPGGVGALSQKLSGSIPNPFSAAIFEKVTPRKFNFNWTIQPQTPEESVKLRDVINHLRYWSLPNPSEKRLILDVPYEWELSFVGTSFLYSFSRCIMSNIDIDYSPNGFNAFMADGAPQAVTISLEFEEIFPLDKSTIDGGGAGAASMRPSGVLATKPEDPTPSSTEQKQLEEAAAQAVSVQTANYTNATSLRKTAEDNYKRYKDMDPNQLVVDINAPRQPGDVADKVQQMIPAKELAERYKKEYESRLQNELTNWIEYDGAWKKYGDETGKEPTQGKLPPPAPPTG